jgi:hypothetical protein
MQYASARSSPPASETRWLHAATVHRLALCGGGSNCRRRLARSARRRPRRKVGDCHRCRIGRLLLGVRALFAGTRRDCFGSAGARWRSWSYAANALFGWSICRGRRIAHPDVARSHAFIRSPVRTVAHSVRACGHSLNSVCLSSADVGRPRSSLRMACRRSGRPTAIDASAGATALHHPAR